MFIVVVKKQNLLVEVIEIWGFVNDYDNKEDVLINCKEIKIKVVLKGINFMNLD